jgi:hypothetical protein
MSDNFDLTIQPAAPKSERDEINRALGNRTVWAGSHENEADVERVDAPTPLPRPQLPGRRAFGGTVELSEGDSIAVFTDHAKNAQRGVYVPSQPPAPPRVTSEPPIFMRAGTDSRILAKDARMDDLVDLGGAIGITTLGSALYNNWLQEKDGGYVKSGEALPPKPVRKAPVKAEALEADDDAEVDLADDTPADTKSDQPAAPQRSYLAHHEESALVAAERTIGEQTFSALEAALTDSAGDLDAIPDALVTNVARSLGVDAAGAKAAIARQGEALSRQAHQAVASMVGDSEAAFNWARSDPKGKELLQNAIRGQLGERSLDGFKSVAHGYLTHLCKTPEGREQVAQGIRAGGHHGVKVESGKVLVDLGKAGGGWTELTSALRGGAIR